MILDVFYLLPHKYINITPYNPTTSNIMCCVLVEIRLVEIQSGLLVVFLQVESLELEYSE